MDFRRIEIKNFRNFSKISIDVSDKNIIFGLNDVGKTNFLSALRFVFDRDYRKNGLTQTDFHKKKTEKNIEILITINIPSSEIGEETDDYKKFFSVVKGFVFSGSTEFFIKLEAVFNNDDLVAEPILFWGVDLKDLKEVPVHGYTTDIDRLFSVVYVDSKLSLDSLFRQNKKDLFKISESPEDQTLLKEIDEKYEKINENISKLSSVTKFSEEITKSYKELRKEDIEILLKSETAIKGIFDDIIPYISDKESKVFYPTSGDGRRKILAYSLLSHLSILKNDKRIPLFFFEEPENHLHSSMQTSISRKLFSSALFENIWVTTHSPLIMSDMDNVTLIRLYNTDKIDAKSYAYKVPDDYQHVKKKLSTDLSNGLFMGKVLLVEGPSEKLLFDHMLTQFNPDYEINGSLVIDILGIGFRPYMEVLEGVGIETYFKTDNDIKYNESLAKYNPLGISRCNNYLQNKDKVEIVHFELIEDQLKTQISIYEYYKNFINRLEDYKIYLSMIDLENDMLKVLKDRFGEILGVDNPVAYLQTSKKYRMIDFLRKATIEDLRLLFDSDEMKVVRCL